MLRKIAIVAAIVLTSRLANAAPVSITACGNIAAPGSYQLAKNLTAAGNCLVLKTGRVTIDLNGFSISGNGTGAAITDGGVPLSRIVIRNGDVLSFQTGIDLSHSQVVTLERLIVTNNQTGIQTGAGAVLRDCFAGWNSPRGGILLGDNCLATGNRVNNNTGFALHVGSSCKVSGNNVSANQAGYAALDAGQNCVITKNSVSKNTQSGIGVQDGSAVTGNLASYNGTNGILASYASTITANTASFNGNDGISTYPTSLISGNTVSANARFGFFAVCPANVVGNAARKNSTDTPGSNYHLVQAGCVTANNL
jgi:hypothetical protein